MTTQAKLNMTKVIARADELVEDFGNQKKEYWMELARVGFNMDPLEFMALGYLVGISDE